MLVGGDVKEVFNSIQLLNLRFSIQYLNVRFVQLFFIVVVEFLDRLCLFTEGTATDQFVYWPTEEVILLASI